MYSSGLTNAQKDLLRLIVKRDDEGRLTEKGVVRLMRGDDKYMLWGCGIDLESLSDLDELCDAGLLKMVQRKPDPIYRITNAGRDAVSKDFEQPSAQQTTTAWTVFYSWQSDLPNAMNRGFIDAALTSAVKSIRKDDSIHIEPVVDRDTLGIPGAPDIAETILDKIEQSQVFVCDVSIINHNDQTHATPNPNVLVELGYALKVLGTSRIIMVMNTAFGEPEMLPFDLRMKRVVTYCALEPTQDRAADRKILATKLEEGIRIIITNPKAQTIENGSSTLSAVFQKVKAKMPELISEMRADLSKDDQEFVREFFLVSKKWTMNYGETRRFTYFFEDHSNLEGKVQVLENYGFVLNVRPGPAKIYRMTEEFVDFLLEAE